MLPYLLVVRPTLEYDASVWNPRLIKYRNSLEEIQRIAASFAQGVTGGELAPQIGPMLNVLGWKNLEARHRDTMLQLMY